MFVEVEYALFQEQIFLNMFNRGALPDGFFRRAFIFGPRVVLEGCVQRDIHSI
jgi:hypothetical protein